MDATERARAREQARAIAHTVRHRMGEETDGHVNDAICALADAIDLLADVIESQERER